MAPAPLLHHHHHHHSQKTVCVMDASGRTGASIVERLLQRGYTVHAATQGCGEGGDLGGLVIKGLSSAENKRLEIFRWDPFDYQTVVDAMKGCSGLFYVFEMPPPDQLLPIYDERDMVEVEVRAAHNVLEACAQTETMEKVVFTSSVTAVVWREDLRPVADNDLDERHWSDPQFCRTFKLWHALAKTLAEKTAWALAMDRGIDMVAVNAGLLAGPGLSAADPYLKGAAEMYERGALVTVDADFLAAAHVRVFEDPSAYGRYLCFDHAVCHPEDAVELARMMAPSIPCPPPTEDLKIVQQRIHNKKLNKVMVDFDGGVGIEAVH